MSGKKAKISFGDPAKFSEADEFVAFVFAPGYLHAIIQAPLADIRPMAERFAAESGGEISTLTMRFAGDSIKLVEVNSQNDSDDGIHIELAYGLLRVFRSCGIELLADILCAKKKVFLAYCEQLDQGQLTIFNNDGWPLDHLRQHIFATHAAYSAIDGVDKAA